jgi:TolB-like protein/DNA-binding winged helix-turn-helix (wHTH) protein/Tfp pilus assembly protein PilF
VASAGIEVVLLRFAAFELDLKNNELRRGGVLLKLSPQQFRVLRWLAEHSGRICTRDEIQREIWGSEIFVDFDRGLNVCIAQIRAALNDDSEAPRFIQTVPRRGYRFIAPVEQITEMPVPQPAATIASPALPVPLKRRGLALAAVILVSLAAAILLWKGVSQNHRTMIAVLPFENVTQRSDDAPMIDGLEDELITQFGALQPELLGVVGRTSVMHYKDRRPGLPEIGRELGVDYVVEGDVRGAGGRLRISTRLVRVAGQAQTWSETYERDESGRFELQEEIAARVGAAVVRVLFPRTPQTAQTAHVPDPKAMEAFVNGRYLVHNSSRMEADRAIGWFEEAAKRDPAYAEPWAAMAQTYVGLALSGASPAPEALDKARISAEKALGLDDRNAEAHNALAEVCFWRDWDWKGAETHFRLALAINPSLAQAWHDQAFYLVATGHAEAGVAALRRAIALDPLSPRVNVDAGWVLLQAHHFDEAVTQARRALELEPSLGEAAGCIARAELYQGKASPKTRDFYRSLLDRKERTSFYNRALAYAVFGRKDEALRALQTSFEQREILMALLKSEPAFSELHGDARFREIVSRMGLPD